MQSSCYWLLQLVQVEGHALHPAALVFEVTASEEMTTSGAEVISMAAAVVGVMEGVNMEVGVIFLVDEAQHAVVTAINGQIMQQMEELVVKVH